ncbi:MAG: hypothetical protein G01um1014107_368 [Parcubacteria group bacterium Gr01-1014_107]|nr:MAG: hypothetical protein G01um1014107_368 [Parcubacteria group bacterium Gr01-1014_107]
MKTNKSYTKRLRITRRGKILARHTGQDHFRAKEKGRKQLGKRKMVSLKLSKKITRRFLGR